MRFAAITTRSAAFRQYAKERRSGHGTLLSSPRRFITVARCTSQIYKQDAGQLFIFRRKSGNFVAERQKPCKVYSFCTGIFSFFRRFTLPSIQGRLKNIHFVAIIDTLRRVYGTALCHLICKHCYQVLCMTSQAQKSTQGSEKYPLFVPLCDF